MGQVVQQAPAVRGKPPAVIAGAAADIQQYLTFLLSGEMYAVGILNVKEIIEYGQLTEIPMMPAFIRGVINLRGSVVPVIDLSARFGGHTTETSRRTCIVIIELVHDEEHHDIGVVVDAHDGAGQSAGVRTARHRVGSTATSPAPSSSRPAPPAAACGWPALPISAGWMAAAAPMRCSVPPPT